MVVLSWTPFDLAFQSGQAFIFSWVEYDSPVSTSFTVHANKSMQKSLPKTQSGLSGVVEKSWV